MDKMEEKEKKLRKQYENERREREQYEEKYSGIVQIMNEFNYHPSTIFMEWLYVLHLYKELSIWIWMHLL